MSTIKSPAEKLGDHQTGGREDREVGERDKGIRVHSRVIDAIKDAIELQGGPSGPGLHFVDKEIKQYCIRILYLMSTKGCPRPAGGTHVILSEDLSFPLHGLANSLWSAW